MFAVQFHVAKKKKKNITTHIGYINITFLAKIRNSSFPKDLIPRPGLLRNHWYSVH